MASNRIKGITIEIGGNVTPLNKALGEVDKSLKETQGELKDVNKLLKLDPSNVELLRQKNNLLKDAIDKTKQRQEELVEALNQLKDAGDTEENQKQQDALQRELIETANKLDDLEREFGEASGATKEAGEELDKADNSASTFADTLKAKLTGEAIIGAVKKLAKGLKELSTGAITLSDNLETQSQKTGLSTDALQEYAYMAELVDTDVDTITGSLSKLTKNMGEAEGGSGAAAEAFAKLGIDIKDTNGELRDNEDVFNDVIDALGNIENETERDATAMALFGKSAQELNPLIKAGSKNIKKYAKEAHDMGYVMDRDMIKKNVEASDAIAKMNNAITGAKNEIGSALAPVIKDVAEWLTTFIQKCRDNKEELAKFGKIAAVAAAALIAFKVASTIASALNAMKAATESATAAQAILNTVLNANPFVLVAAAVAAVTAALVIFSGTWAPNSQYAASDLKDEMNELSAALDSNEEEWGSVFDAQQKILSKGESELGYYEDLWGELKQITDENGNVQEGYEERAEFIVSTLAEALGIEIEYIDGQIKGYQELQLEIDKLLVKKRAEIQLKSGEESYKKAIQERDKATADLIKTSNTLAGLDKKIADNDKEYKEAYEQYTKALKLANNDHTNAVVKSAQERVIALNEEGFRLQSELEATQEAYGKAEKEVERVTYTIEQYEANLAAAHEEEYEKINTINYETVEAYMNMSKEEQKAMDEIYGDLMTSAVEQYKAGKYTAEQFLAGALEGTKNKSLRNQANGEVKSFATTLSNTMKRTLQVKSPSKVTEEIGKYFVQGFGVGVEDEEQAAYKDVAAFGQSTISTLQRSVAGGASATLGVNSTGANALIRGTNTGGGIGGVNVSVVVNGNVDNYEQLASVIGQKLQQQMARQERAAFA